MILFIIFVRQAKFEKVSNSNKEELIFLNDSLNRVRNIS